MAQFPRNNSFAKGFSQANYSHGLASKEQKMRDQKNSAILS